MRTLTGHTKGVGAVALSADGTRALSGSDDKTLKVWDLLDGNCLATVFLEGDVNVVAVSPNGKTIVAGDEGGNMYFLKLEGIADSEQKLQPTSINDINNTEGWIQRLWQNVKTKLRG